MLAFYRRIMQHREQLSSSARAQSIEKPAPINYYAYFDVFRLIAVRKSAALKSNREAYGVACSTCDICQRLD